MGNVFQDIINVLTSFGVVDYILYFAILTLIILIISLIYIMRNEKNESVSKDTEVKAMDTNEVPKEEENGEIDLKAIANTINEKPKPLIDMTAYEEEQEKKAIISYDELLKESNKDTINYQDEELVDNVIPVKKIQVSPVEVPNADMSTLTNFVTEKPIINVLGDGSNSPPNHVKVELFHYEKEEAFLKALQQLNELLN